MTPPTSSTRRPPNLLTLGRSRGELANGGKERELVQYLMRRMQRTNGFELFLTSYEEVYFDHTQACVRSCLRPSFWVYYTVITQIRKHYQTWSNQKSEKSICVGKLWQGVCSTTISRTLCPESFLPKDFWVMLLISSLHILETAVYCALNSLTQNDLERASCLFA